jgi:hypothetical protein
MVLWDLNLQNISYNDYVIASDSVAIKGHGWLSLYMDGTGLPSTPLSTELSRILILVTSEDMFIWRFYFSYFKVLWNMITSNMFFFINIVYIPNNLYFLRRDLLKTDIF